MKTSVVAVSLAALVAEIVLPWSSAGTAEAATVRRHMRCEIIYYQSPINLPPPFSIPPGWGVKVTNTFAMTVPKGTAFTYTVGGKSHTYKSTVALSQNQAFFVGKANGQGTCSATIPF